LHEQLHVKKLIIGHDHRFGHNREDNFQQYQQYGKKLGIEIEQTIPFVESETTISSSVIRRLLEQGDIEQANEYLNYEYSLSGIVVYGQQNGRKINFPTANLAVDDIHKLIPRLGVYAVKVEVDGEHYFGMLNIGIRPTIDVNNKIPTIEVNIFDFNRNIYSHNLKLIFVKRVRDEVRFKDLAELSEQIKKDQEVIQNIFKTSV
jgi:riboflavin kinase/FMN adenylyltransferase